jgi:putative endonuclease
MTLRRAAGDAYEIAAERHAQAQGLQTLDRNVSCRFGEIDLVLRDRDVVVFAEVRYRDSQRFGGALASVDPRKQRRMIAAAQFYLQSRPALSRAPCRFDVFAIEGEIGAPQIQWIRDAFRVEA